MSYVSKEMVAAGPNHSGPAAPSTEAPSKRKITDTIDAAEDYAEARALFDAAVTGGYVPTEEAFAALARKAGSFGFSFFVLRRMTDYGLAPSQAFFRVPLAQARLGVELVRLFDEMAAAGLAIEADFVAEALVSIGDFAEAMIGFDRARCLGLTDVAPVLTALRSEIRCLEGARRLIAELRCAGLEETREDLRCAAAFAADFASAIDAMRTLVAAGGVVDEDLALHAMHLARCFEEGRQIVEMVAFTTAALEQAWLAMARDQAEEQIALAVIRDRAELHGGKTMVDETPACVVPLFAARVPSA